MGFHRNEKGFTLVNQLFILAILIICIPLQAIIYKTFSENTYYEEISIQQFFHYIQREVNQAIDYQIQSDTVSLTLATEDIVTFEAYGTLIRRQVNHQGHEIFLREVKLFKATPLPYGFKLILQSKKGEQYEKDIVFFPQ